MAEEAPQAESGRARLGRSERADRFGTTGAGAPEERDFWRFADGDPICIVSGQQVEPPPEAEDNHRNHMTLASYADLDSLVEIFGHLRSRNPNADVRFTRPADLRGEDLHSHLVIVGNMALVQTGIADWFPLDYPVSQVRVPDIADGEVFEVYEPDGQVTRHGPVLSRDKSTVIADIGFLARMPSPTDLERTLTICSGVYTRGVLGSIRCLTDQRVASANNGYLSRRFKDASTFGVLLRILVRQRLVSAPRLDDPNTRLFEFAGLTENARPPAG